MRAFLAAAEPTPGAMLLAARILDGAALRGLDAAPLRDWAAATLAALPAEAATLHAALALAEAGALPAPPDLETRLAEVAGGSVWLWALAHDASALPGHLARAIAAQRPHDPLGRGLALLRLHQATGHGRWSAAARRIAAQAGTETLDGALLTLECAAPWRAMPPPWRLAPIT